MKWVREGQIDVYCERSVEKVMGYEVGPYSMMSFITIIHDEFYYY